MFAITLASSGINLATTRVVSEELALGNRHKANLAAKKALAISFFCSLFVSLLLFLFSSVIVSTCFHNKVSVWAIYLMAICLPFISMSNVISGYFTALRKTYKSASGQVVEQISKMLICMCILSCFLPAKLDFICFALIIGDVLSEIISFAFIGILYYFEQRKSYSYTRGSFSTNTRHITKRIFTILLPITFTSCIRSGLSTLKQIILPISLEKNGMDCSLALSLHGKISGMAMPIVLFFSFIIQSFGSLLVPEFARYHAKKDKKRAREVSYLILSLTFIFSISLSILLYFTAPFLGNFIYSDFEVGKYIKLFSPLVVIMYLDTVVDYILKGLNAQVAVMYINIVDLVCSLVILYFFAPVLGIWGYILSIYISEILNFVLSFLKLKSMLKKEA